MIPVSRPSLTSAEVEAVGEVMASGMLAMGDVTRQFEAQLSDRFGQPAVAVSNGTAALQLALQALHAPGGEVILPSLTFLACPQAVLAAGMKPVFCEVLPSTLCMDPADVARLVNERTAAVMPVDYAGIACDMAALRKVCGRAALIEDAAHAFGSEGVCQGDVTCFSFDAIKNLTCGEGGAVVTNNERIADEVTSTRQLGMAMINGERMAVGPGWRYHMPNLNAAIGLAQLKRFDEMSRRRRELMQRYQSAFSECRTLELLDYGPGVTPFVYTVLMQRPGFQFAMRKAGIATQVNYPPAHLMYAFDSKTAWLPVTESLRPVSLPLFPDMTDSMQELVISTVLAWS